MEKGIETIEDNKVTIAIIIRNEYCVDGVKFFTPGSFSQQLAFMAHKPGKTIPAHTHNIVKREIHYTQEVLIIKKGKLKVNLYNIDKKHIGSHILNAGDIILLAAGGHGFQVLEELEMIEIKQGPYLGEGDKTRFKGIEK